MSHDFAHQFLVVKYGDIGPRTCMEKCNHAASQQGNSSQEKREPVEATANLRDVLMERAPGANIARPFPHLLHP